MPFDEFLNPAQNARSKPAGEKQRLPEETEDIEGRSPSTQKKSSPWADIEPPQKEATIRLNVDIPLSLNDRLAEKARQLRKPKTELVRRLLEWALDESVE